MRVCCVHARMHGQCRYRGQCRHVASGNAIRRAVVTCLVCMHTCRQKRRLSRAGTSERTSTYPQTRARAHTHTHTHVHQVVEAGQMIRCHAVRALIDDFMDAALRRHHDRDRADVSTQPPAPPALPPPPLPQARDTSVAALSPPPSPSPAPPSSAASLGRA